MWRSNGGITQLAFGLVNRCGSAIFSPFVRELTVSHDKLEGLSSRLDQTQHVDYVISVVAAHLRDQLSDYFASLPQSQIASDVLSKNRIQEFVQDHAFSQGRFTCHIAHLEL
jgi:hypothetical protein